MDTLLTNERLATYQTVFNPATDIELMGAYLWNAQVCGTLYPLVSAAEVALRNSIDQAIQPDLGQFWWSPNKLHYKSYGLRAALPDPVRIVRQNFSSAFNAARKVVVKATGHKSAQPTHGAVVANTEFSTWENLLDAEFMGRGLIWPKHVGQVFNGPWPTKGGPTGALQFAKGRVKVVREFRNRLSHHEPAWKRYGVATELDAMQHLQEKIDRIEELVMLIQPEKAKLLDRNGFLPAARRVCTSEELRRYQHLHVRSRVGTMRKLNAIVSSAYTDDRSIEVATFMGMNRRFLLTPMPK